MEYTIVLMILVGIVLAAVCLVISYQHEQIRKKIVERAKSCGCVDIKKLDAALDEMLGPDIRGFCASDDAAFQCRLNEILSDQADT